MTERIDAAEVALVVIAAVVRLVAAVVIGVLLWLSGSIVPRREMVRCGRCPEERPAVPFPAPESTAWAVLPAGEGGAMDGDWVEDGQAVGWRLVDGEQR